VGSRWDKASTEESTASVLAVERTAASVLAEERTAASVLAVERTAASVLAEERTAASVLAVERAAASCFSALSPGGLPWVGLRSAGWLAAWLAVAAFWESLGRSSASLPPFGESEALGGSPPDRYCRRPAIGALPERVVGLVQGSQRRVRSSRGACRPSSRLPTTLAVEKSLDLGVPRAS